MPCILKIRVIEARDLPVMDRSSELTDAYVEIKFADNETQQTKVSRKTLNPVWNEDFRFEVPDDSLLQDEPLELKVWDYDVVSSNDMIGVVYIDLNCLLMEDSAGQIAGWFPIYDNLRGIRGQLSVTTKLEFFVNDNPFKDASSGVQFFSVDTPFSIYRISHIHGFMEELIVEDDPEYHWTDNFRASRISNYERQSILYKLSGTLRRKLGRKILDGGGNAILGYRQHFDLEGETGIVARGYGTAVRLKRLKIDGNTNSPFITVPLEKERVTSSSASPTLSPLIATPPRERDVNKSPTLQLSTDPELPPEVQEGVSLPISTPTAHPDVQLLTLSSFQSSIVVRIGGMITARSVKLLDTRRSDMHETRDIWWAEIRNEIKAHARSLNCLHVVGYTETTTMQPNDELCVFSASGTAAILDLSGSKIPKRNFAKSATQSSEDIPDALIVDEKRVKGKKRVDIELQDTSTRNKIPSSVEESEFATRPKRKKEKRKDPKLKGKDGCDTKVKVRERRENMDACRRFPAARPACSFCHIPYKHLDAPFPMRLVRCALCRRRYVPEVLLATIEPPPGLAITGCGRIVEARVCRAKKKNMQGDVNATVVSEAIPFLEYELHRQLMYKLKLLGMNAAFGLKFSLAIGEGLIVGVATATACFLTALPPPIPLHIKRTLNVLDDKDKSLLSIQHKIEHLSKFNSMSFQNAPSRQQPDTYAKYFPDAELPPAEYIPTINDRIVEKHNRHQRNKKSERKKRRQRTGRKLHDLGRETDNIVDQNRDDLQNTAGTSSSAASELNTSSSFASGSHGQSASDSFDSDQFGHATSDDSTEIDTSAKKVQKRRSRDTEGIQDDIHSPSSDTGYESSSSNSDPPKKSKRMQSRKLVMHAHTSEEAGSNIMYVNDDNTGANSMNNNIDAVGVNKMHTGTNKGSESDETNGEAGNKSETGRSSSPSYERETSSGSDNIASGAVVPPSRFPINQSNHDDNSESSHLDSFDNIQIIALASKDLGNAKYSHKDLLCSIDGPPKLQTVIEDTAAKYMDATTSESNDPGKDRSNMYYSDSSVLEAFTDQKVREPETAYIVEVDDEIDEDTLAVLLDPTLPLGSLMCNTDTTPGIHSTAHTNVQLVTALKRVEWDVSSGHLNQKLSSLFHSLYSSVIFKLRAFSPCILMGVHMDVQVPEENQVQLLMTAMCIMDTSSTPTPSTSPSPSPSPSPSTSTNALVSGFNFQPLFQTELHQNSNPNLLSQMLPNNQNSNETLCISDPNSEQIFPESKSAIPNNSLHNNMTLQSSISALTSVSSSLTNISSNSSQPNVVCSSPKRKSSATPSSSNSVNNSPKSSIIKPNPISIPNLSLGQANPTTIHLPPHVPLAAPPVYSSTPILSVNPTLSGGKPLSESYTFIPEKTAPLSIPSHGSASNLLQKNVGKLDEDRDQPIVVNNDLAFDMSPPRSPVKHFTKPHPELPIRASAAAASPLQYAQGINSFVELTPLSHIPGMRLEKYLGHMHIHFIKESFAVRESGGLGSFTHGFLTEVNAIMRSHVANVGGNALIGYHIESLMIVQDNSKDKGYSLVSISGDAFVVRCNNFRQPPQQKLPNSINMPTT